ncbi:MAG TPA: tetratricopeptide repeat protein, partial [Gammaproteobacteria bacterium]|nr:tetratricopeptide repeat protein [Gammaproteobacteria bacterium]
ASVPPAPVAATPPAAAEADSGVANAQESAPPAQTEEAEAAGPVVDEATRERFSEAIAALNNGDDARAEALLKSVIEAQERLASPHTNLGILYTRQERLEEALAQLQKATELNPDDYVALNYLGIVQRKLGHFTAARDAYQQALKLKPDYPFAHLNIAILFDLYLGELDRALAHYERYQALDGGQNNKLTAWLADLKQRIRSSKEEAQP